jgi:hypothetical protein
MRTRVKCFNIICGESRAEGRDGVVICEVAAPMIEPKSGELAWAGAYDQVQESYLVSSKHEYMCQLSHHHSHTPPHLTLMNDYLNIQLHA